MPIDRDLLLVIKSSSLGEGPPDLGERLMENFLKMLMESGRLPARIICMNSGIFLTTAGSPVIALIKKYEENGTEILSCTTCLEYFKRTDKLLVGKPTTMKDSVAAMLAFRKVIAP